MSRTTAHILIADETGGIGFECDPLGSRKLEMLNGIVTYSNHFPMPHKHSVKDIEFLKGSVYRIDRMDELVKGTKDSGLALTEGAIIRILNDEGNYPIAINRAQCATSTIATLFSVVMDLPAKTASARIDMPTESTITVLLRPTEILL